MEIMLMKLNLFHIIIFMGIRMSFEIFLFSATPWYHVTCVSSEISEIFGIHEEGGKELLCTFDYAEMGKIFSCFFHHIQMGKIFHCFSHQYSNGKNI